MQLQQPHPQRTVIVTGAGSPRGIGLATARRYAQEGWAVVVTDISADGVATSVDTLSSEYDVPVFGQAGDVSSQDSVQALADAVAAKVAAGELPQVGAVANIAGIPSPSSFQDMTLDEWNRVLAVNLTGCFLVAQAFTPAMIEGGYGRVVNMSSVTAQHGGGVFSKTGYAAAKAGVIGLTKGMARELAQYGITVNAVAPGVVDTDIRVGSDAENEMRLAASVPLGRQCAPEEIAALYVWLSSADAAYITGTTQSINGGTYVY